MPKIPNSMRPAGQSLSDRIGKLSEMIIGEGNKVLVFIVGATALALAGVWFFDFILGESLLASFVFLAFLFVLLRRDKQGRVRLSPWEQKRRNAELGLEGEQKVSYTLRNLEGMADASVFDDVQNPPYGNIDHILVCPKGLFVFETKMSEKKKRIRVHGNAIREQVYDMWKPVIGRDPLDQAKENAKHIFSMLREARIQIRYIRAIVVYANAEVFVKRPPSHEAAVCDLKGIAAEINKTDTKFRLTSEQMAEIVRYLEDNEQKRAA